MATLVTGCILSAASFVLELSEFRISLLFLLAVRTQTAFFVGSWSTAFATVEIVGFGHFLFLASCRSSRAIVTELIDATKWAVQCPYMKESVR